MVAQASAAETRRNMAGIIQAPRRMPKLLKSLCGCLWARATLLSGTRAWRRM